jgi:hypothetical protein
MRSKRSFAIVFGLTLVALAGSDAPMARADQCSAEQPWPARAWWVRCSTEVIDYLDRDDLSITNELYEAVECDDTRTTGVAAATRGELEAASAWLESLCFRSPDVPLEDRDGRRANVAWVSQAMQALPPDERVTCEGGRAVPPEIGAHPVTSVGVYVCSNLYVDFTSFFAMGQTLEEMRREVPFMGTMVHELFHAVQARYPLWRDEWPIWIGEGTAEAVMLAWLSRQTGAVGRLDHRVYDAPLQRPVDDSDGYATHRWWLWLGSVLQSQDVIAYLADLFVEFDFAEHDGLQDLETWLDDQGTGLYELFPRFVAESLDREVFYSGVHNETIRYRDDRIVEEEHSGRVREVAAEAVGIKAEVPDGASAELTIRIRPDHDDLHLAVGETGYSTPGGASAFGESQNDLKPEFRDPGWVAARNVFRTVISGGEQPREYLARVANVGRDPVATSGRDFRLEIELEPLKGCRFSASLSGDTTSTAASGRVAQFSTNGGATSTGLLSNSGNTQGVLDMLQQFAGDRMTEEERAEMQASAEQWQQEAAAMPTETLGLNLIEMDMAAGPAANLASAMGGFRLSASVFDQPIESGFRGGLKPGLVVVHTGDMDLDATAQTRFEWAPGEPGSASIEIMRYDEGRLTGTINAELEAAGVRDENTGEPLRIQVSADFIAQPHDPMRGRIACLPDD